VRGSMIASVVLCLILTVTVSTSQAIDISLVGADPGPNATGEIPAWEGHKKMTCPSGYTRGDYFPNPYAGEKPLFRIDHTNVDQYKDRLSPGQVMRLKKHENFYMNVYPTHRNQEFCPEFYAAVEKNKQSCYVDEKGILQGFDGAIAFPNPKNGLEAIWNVRRMYLGDDADALTCRRVVSPSGKVKKTMWETKVLNYGQTRLKSVPFPNPDGVFQKIRNLTTYPADEKGVDFLSIAYLDDNRLDDTWLFLPTLRRVRRAPTMTNGGQLDGELTMDENGIEFRGTVNNWNWKLIGKKEMYVAYNNYELWPPDAEDEEECWAMDMNPERIRYELHRVWVVEGTLKEGLDHPYSKRVGYYDEDSWQPEMADRYDKRGNLWRMYEAYPYSDACNKMRMIIGYVYMNLESGRYELFGGCRKLLPKTTVYDTGLAEDLFTVQALRTSGR
jgi:Protein of unknown function (DUF1329)